MGRIFITGRGSSGSGNGIPTDICKSLRMKQIGDQVSLNWKDPNDTIVDGQVLATWSHTILTRKKGGYPENPNDGVRLTLSDESRNAYDVTPFVDTVPDTENEYFYRLFPVSVNGVVNLDKSCKFGEAEIYEFTINKGNSNSKGAVKYGGKNANYTPAFMDFTNDEFNFGDWEGAFFLDLFKPCMLKHDGTVDYFLNPNNFAEKADGGASDIANTAYDGEAMVQVGQIWIKETNENGLQKIQIANKQVDASWDCFTHYNKNNELQEFIYRAMYDGSNIGNKIRSLSGQALCSNVAGNTQRSYCRAHGTGWANDEWSFRRLINYLLILMGKSLNTQDVYGTGRYTGYVNTSNTGQLPTGQNNAKGMFYGDNNNGAVTVFYMENWWGNIWKITDGIIQSGGNLLYKLTPGTIDGSTAIDYNENGQGYRDSGIDLAGTITELYIREMELVPTIGLVPKATTGGSSSTYYADGMWSNSSVVGFARFGSSPSHGLLVGAFAFAVDSAVSLSNRTCGVALSYKPS